MEWERQRTYDREAGREEGRAEGRVEGRAETISALLANNVSIEIIAKSLKMSVDEVKQISTKQ